MEEREFFVEARAQRNSPLNCPFCKQVNDYALTWLYRKKKANLNLDRMDERDRARYEKAQSYMVLLDDHATCMEEGCRRRFEISGMKTMAFVTPEQLEEVSFGNEGRRDGRFRQQQPRPQQQSRGQGQTGRGGGGGQRGDDFGNREGYGNRGGQGGPSDRGRKQSGGGQGGPRRGDENRQGGQQGGQQGGRKGNAPQPYSPSQWNEQQGLRSPRGKRSDPTGPGGGWH